MDSLKCLREGWDALEAEKARLLRRMTVQESVVQYLELQRALEPQFRQTEVLFRPERMAYLAELQRRLARLEEWKSAPSERSSDRSGWPAGQSSSGGPIAWRSGERGDGGKLLESLAHLQKRLREAGIPSAAVGGIALSVWGEPRATRDVDVRVLLRRKEAARLLEVLGTEYVALSDDPLQTLIHFGFLFVEDRWGTRLDLLLSDTDFDAEGVQRARSVELMPGLSVDVCSAEDLLIYKLISTRSRDHEDAVSIIRRQGDTLDDAYVLNWLRQFEQALDDSTLVAEYRRLRNI